MTAPNTLAVQRGFTGGGLGYAAQAAAFANFLNMTITTQLAASVASANPAVTLTINNATASFSGTFTLTDMLAGATKPLVRNVTFKGLVAPGLSGAAGNIVGRGFYKLTQLPGATPVVLTGAVTITK